jgi:predicted dehydrogenase
MPALVKCEEFEYAGVAVHSNFAKAAQFKEVYGGEVFANFDALLKSDVDSVYIPLPPALHYEWGKKSLEAGKHVFMEKPFTILLENTRELLELAETKNLALHENYMFRYHAQIDEIKRVIEIGEIGDVRLIRIDFGFPFKGANDFRYNNALGGGALLDCGGYTIKLAQMFLDGGAKVTTSNLSSKSGFDVDIYGSATLRDDSGRTVQIAFGMDNDYRCELDIWGSAGTLKATRILTAPDGMEPPGVIRKNGIEQTLNLPSDDTFLKSIYHFVRCIDNEQQRKENYSDILRQSELHLSLTSKERK